MIQFSISIQFNSIWSIDRNLSCVTSPGQRRPGNDSHEGVLRIPQTIITGTSPPDCLLSYPRHSLSGGILPLCRDKVGVFCSPSWQGKIKRTLFMMVKRANKHICKILGNLNKFEMQNTKLHFAELYIDRGVYYQCDGKISPKRFKKCIK